MTYLQIIAIVIYLVWIALIGSHIKKVHWQAERFWKMRIDGVHLHQKEDVAPSHNRIDIFVWLMTLAVIPRELIGTFGTPYSLGMMLVAFLLGVLLEHYRQKMVIDKREARRSPQR